MVMFGIGKEKGLVGLDIGSDSIKAIEFKTKKKDGQDVYEVTKIGLEYLPHDSIVEGTIIDSEAVAETIKLIFDGNKISNKNVAISVSGSSVIIKKISLPAMETDELAESIIWEARHNIPYPYEETNVDYAIMKPSSQETDASVDILLVAAKKDKVSNYSNAVQQAKKNLHIIEVDVFALQNTMEVNYPEISKEKTVAIINLGANATNVIISEKETPQLFRDLAIGGALIAENIRKDLGTSAEDAEKILKGMPVADIPEEQSQNAINTNVENLFEEIEKTFSFYRAGEEEKKIDKVFLSGGLANLKGLAKSFEDRFKIETEIFNPFRNIFYNDKKLDSTFFQELSPLFGVASGLATRKMEE